MKKLIERIRHVRFLTLMGAVFLLGACEVDVEEGEDPAVEIETPDIEVEEDTTEDTVVIDTPEVDVE